MKCEICDKDIVNEPVTTERIISYGNGFNDYEQKDIKVFCSEKCKYINEILDPTHRIIGDLKTIINHLIKSHGLKIDILEEALNSKEFKSLWDGDFPNIK